jgi:hemerythrin-like domain-containing protein
MASPLQDGSDFPIRNFSDCHVGIVKALGELGGLPDMIENARRGREVAGHLLAYFQDVVLTHHREEEDQLFPAVQASAVPGDERDKIDMAVALLTAQHRKLEAGLKQVEPALKAAAKGADAEIDAGSVARLVEDYLAHARYEEQVFLPLAQTILGRDSHHMAALGLSLHVRHASKDMMRRFNPL